MCWIYLFPSFIDKVVKALKHAFADIVVQLEDGPIPTLNSGSISCFPGLPGSLATGLLPTAPSFAGSPPLQGH